MTQEIEIPNIGMTFSREIMPQIKRDQFQGLFKFLDNKGVSYSKSLLDTNNLKSTQSDFDKDKIILMMMDRITKPIIVSNDNYVLDGHHRWLADHNNNQKTEAWVVDLPIMELMRTTKEYLSNQELNEEITHKEFGPMMDEFMTFASKHLGIKSLPNVKYKTEDDGMSSFGAYNPTKNEIVLQTKNRNPMDVFRTLAHELVHHKQNEEGRIKDIARDGDDGSDIENEAHIKTGVMLRQYGRKNSHMFNTKPLVESLLTEAKAIVKRKRVMRPANKATGKAVFVVGPAGSGKDFVAKKTLVGHGLSEVNTDPAFEHLMNREGIPKDSPQSQKRSSVRAKAKNLTRIKQNALINSGRGIYFNTTGHDHEKIKAMKDELERRGYDTKMVFVNTSNETSRARNVARGKKGGRLTPEPARQEYWNKTQKAIPHYKKMFGDNFHHVDNSLDYSRASDEEKLAKEAEFNDIHKTIRDWATSKPENPIGRAKVEAEASKRRNKPKRKPVARQPQPPRMSVSMQISDKVNAQAKLLGLKHYGSGYFGPRQKGPKGEPNITHRAVGDNLVKTKKKALIPPAQRIDESFEDYMSKSENRLDGTDSLANIYKMMTPGQGQTTKKKKLVRKALAQENLGQNAQLYTYSNRPDLSNFMGSTVFTSASPYPQLATGAAYSGLAESIVNWMKKPETQDRFLRKYNELAEQKLIETARKMNETVDDSIRFGPKTFESIRESLDGGVGLMGTVSSVSSGQKGGQYQDTFSGAPSQNIMGENDPKKKGRLGARLAGYVKKVLKEKRKDDPCEAGYEQYGMKEKNGRKVPDCIPIKEAKTAAWQRKEGKNPEGGLNKKGVESYRRENPGSKLQTAVTTEPSKLKKGSKSWKRRKSFCARMGGMPGPMKDEKGRPTRKALSLRKWNCE